LTSLTHYAWAASAVIDKTIVKLRDNIEAGFLAVKEYRTEKLASDSSDEKRIKKAQERAFKQKLKSASNNAKKIGLHPAFQVFSLETIGCFFEVSSLTFL